MRRITLLVTTALLASAPALAQSNQAQRPAQKGEAKAQALADAEVRKVDRSAGKVTLKHGPLPALDMPAMTMVFRVKDPAMLDKLKAGDSIRFKAEKIGGNYTITEYQPSK